MAAQVGKQAPPFKCTAVVDGKLKEVTLDGYTAANHWLILVFFPKAWSFICPTEIKAFSSRLEEFLYARSCAVVFASTDSEHCLKAWNAASSQNEGGLGGVHVPLISDCNHKLSRDYGVLIEEQGVAQRALFIIDPKGRIRGSTINDADVGRSVDEALRVLDALAFKDEFGEGCPVDWKKGDKGIDYKAETTIEGAIEVKKSWSEWARPKLQRAWSGASGVSTFSSTPPTSRPTYERSISHSGNHSPLVSPGMRASHASLQAQMEEALLQQRMENMNAAMQNQSVGMAV
ncbi:putative Thioredoxin domain-containing protein [Septoria linicola]|nr:putative Thioredoxin domain-containing protein [Septoria linicola]